MQGIWSRKGTSKTILQLTRHLQKTIRRVPNKNCSSTPTVGRGFSVRAGPDNGSASAPLKSINSDLEDKLSREPPTTTDLTKTITIWLQQGKFDLPWAIYIQVKLGHGTPGNVKRLQNDQLTREIRRAAREFYVESLSTNKTAQVTKATIYSKLSFMKWYTKILAYQEKAGKTPHTLHKRRPQNNPDEKDSHPAMLQTSPQLA